ncbi:DUF2306 domain-containing protein [Myxococcus sp. Y35]|uniref:DUF2306 domain-containing protein n=1 Tax=Pseudomyxococcus flavus TaxID=3115648 RepID=UPI003CEFFF82
MLTKPGMTEAQQESPHPTAPTGRPPGRPKWWQRPWIAPLAFVSVLFVALSLPPYLSLEPEQSRVPQPDDFAAHYPLLVVHVVFGAVALLTTLPQVWPWFRRRYPVAHRHIGRVYVFGGVLPAGLTALPLGAFSPFGPLAQVSTVLMALLWLLFTVTGYRRARRRQYIEHRQWMLRSFALTASIITNRFWGVVGFLVLSPQLDTTFEGSEKMLTWTVAGLSTWLGWVVPLLITEWWLNRGEAARRGARLPTSVARSASGAA